MGAIRDCLKFSVNWTERGGEAMAYRESVKLMWQIMERLRGAVCEYHDSQLVLVRESCSFRRSVLPFYGSGLARRTFTLERQPGSGLQVHRPCWRI